MKKLLLIITLVPTLIFANTILKPQGPVNDFAKVLDPQNKKRLVTLLTELERQAKIAMVVVTIPSLEGSDIEGYAVNLYQQWGIGQRGEDKGVLILTAIEDRTARIEVGYGLEGIIPDAFAGNVLRETLFPYFRKGLYGEGFFETSLVLIGRLENKLGFQLKGSSIPSINKQPPSLFNKWVHASFILLFLYLLIRHPFLFLFFLGNMRRGGGLHGGGFGRGFGGFGGGLSGGGGASGRW